MVRLPCGSMSTQRTRLPVSANAAARFRVVVVLATPPFWFANAMTLAWGLGFCTCTLCVFAGWSPNPPRRRPPPRGDDGRRTTFGIGTGLARGPPAQHHAGAGHRQAEQPEPPRVHAGERQLGARGLGGRAGGR